MANQVFSSLASLGEVKFRAAIHDSEPGLVQMNFGACVTIDGVSIQPSFTFYTGNAADLMALAAAIEKAAAALGYAKKYEEKAA